MKKTAILLLIFFLIPLASEAQCSMCRAVLETQGDNRAAEGINDGIMYLMIFPYLLMGGLGYFIYRSFKKGREHGKSSEDLS